LFALAAPQANAERMSRLIARNLMGVLDGMAKIYQPTRQIAEAEKCYYEILASPWVEKALHMHSLQGLAQVNIYRRNWRKGVQFCEEALKLLFEIGPEWQIFTIYTRLLVMLGDAMEGQGDWAQAHQYDQQVLDMWEKKKRTSKMPSEGIILNAVRREGMRLVRESRPDLAVKKMEGVPSFYVTFLEVIGINFMHLDQLFDAMAALKAWAECLLGAPVDEELIAYVKRVLADVTETENIIEAYEAGVLDETRREARKARAAIAGEATTSADGERNTVASPAGKSKAAKRKQQKRKAQQQKKRAAESSSSSSAAAVAGGLRDKRA